jgi:hypothetical protein
MAGGLDMALIYYMKLWKSKNIPYLWTAGAWNDKKKEILGAVDDWNRHTQINLIPYPEYIQYTWRHVPPTNFIKFVRGETIRSQSSVGMIGGQQNIHVAGASERTIVHEIGHALGLWHEHQRPDRDLYVYIVEEQMSKDEYERNFSVKTVPWSLFFGKYDCSSIMHYPAQAKYKSGKKFYYFNKLPWGCTSLKHVKRTLSDGSKTWLSDGDISAINYFYEDKNGYPFN